jgi:hypothetical protein
VTAPPVDLLDVGVFAERLLNRPLWDHQLELARSPARYRVCCAGRQVGKSTMLAVIALHRAFTRRNSLILLVSAGETASKRLLDEAASMAQSSPLLGGSVLDAIKSQITLSNGSRIVSVPASERQIRGASVDLLVIDEAGFVDQAIWRSAEPAIVAKPGSKVILCSSPWGSADHFFRSLWTRGMDAPDEKVASWHWPSSASPAMDDALLEDIREREDATYFRREFLAEWTDASGAYFSEAELMGAVVDYELTPPEQLANYLIPDQWTPTAAGVDWGFRVDANAVALLGLLAPGFCSDRRWRLFIPWMCAEYGWDWDAFINYLMKLCRTYQVKWVASERNGVGDPPTETLKKRLFADGAHTWVKPVWTDVNRKQSGFGRMRMLLQQDRLVLPRHPELLKQLRSLEFEQTTGGSMKISVPERSGHDDLAMATMQAVSMVETFHLRDGEAPFGWVDQPDLSRMVLTGKGVALPRRPLPSPYASWIQAPKGGEKGDGW